MEITYIHQIYKPLFNSIYKMLKLNVATAYQAVVHGARETVAKQNSNMDINWLFHATCIWLANSGRKYLIKHNGHRHRLTNISQDTAHGSYALWHMSSNVLNNQQSSLNNMDLIHNILEPQLQAAMIINCLNAV